MAAPLIIGIDQGYTKTAMAVADGAGHVLFAAAQRCSYAQLTGKEDAAARSARYTQRLQHLLAQAAAHISGQAVHIVFAGNIPADGTALTAALAQHNCTLQKIDSCTDALGHYGLSSMPDRAFVIGAGSGVITAYVDAQFNYRTPPEPHWEISTSGNLLSAGGLSNGLLDLYVDEQLAATPGLLSQTIEQVLGARTPSQSLYHYLAQQRTRIGRGRRLELAQSIPALLHLPVVDELVERCVADAVRYLHLLTEYVQDPQPQALVLGGSVALGIPDLAARFARHLPQLSIELAHGNPAEGLVRYRTRHPAAHCDITASADYFAHWTRQSSKQSV